MLIFDSEKKLGLAFYFILIIMLFMVVVGLNELLTSYIFYIVLNEEIHTLFYVCKSSESK